MFNFRKQACCDKCNEQYSLEQFAWRSREITKGFTCPKCTENERECTLVANKKQLEMQNNEGRRLVIEAEKENNEGKRLAIQQEEEKRVTLLQQQQHEKEEGEKSRSHENEIKRIEATIAVKKVEQEKEINEGKRLAIQQEEEKRTTIRQQQQHDREESEKKRLHDIEIKKREATMADKKIKADKELKKIEIEERHKSNLKQQQERHRHDADMQDRLNEAKRLDMKAKEHQIQVEKERHRHKEEMQDKRIAEKAIELNRLQMEALLKFGPESLANLKFLQKQNAQLQNQIEGQ